MSATGLGAGGGDGPHTEAARLRALVRGRVQGVFFRQFTSTHARRLGLTGWVSNLSNGMTVEVVAEGPAPALEELLIHLRQGPPGAYVEAVDVHWESTTSELSSFQVR